MKRIRWVSADRIVKRDGTIRLHGAHWKPNTTLSPGSRYRVWLRMDDASDRLGLLEVHRLGARPRRAGDLNTLIGFASKRR